MMKVSSQLIERSDVKTQINKKSGGSRERNVRIYQVDTFFFQNCYSNKRRER